MCLFIHAQISRGLCLWKGSLSLYWRSTILEKVVDSVWYNYDGVLFRNYTVNVKTHLMKDDLPVAEISPWIVDEPLEAGVTQLRDARNLECIRAKNTSTSET